MSPNLPVVVGLDGRFESLVTAEWAAREALLRGVPLRLVHVPRQSSPPYAALAGVVVPTDPQGSEHELDLVRASLSRRHPGLDVTAEQIAGDTVTILLAAAADAGLLVLGSRGLGRTTGFLLGSVSRLVAARAQRPVVLVRSFAQDGQDGQDADRTTAAPEPSDGDVVVGVDLAGPADAVLAFAFDAASRRGAGLRVVHGSGQESEGISATELTGVNGGGPAVAPEWPLADLLRPWEDKFPDVSVTEQAVVGQAGSHLVDASRTAALLVVGRAARHAPVGAQIGPVTEAALHYAESPVAVIPHD
ncbi:universal stress protein [Streptomyces bobili]|uniref:universal stress protein n=1 Tax=Streptomyces bobili TaxID=67280 RepID=UPI00365FB935